MASLKEIEGIGEVYAAKLKDAGVTTTDQLLEKGASPKGREDLAASAGVSGKLILEWVNYADLAQRNADNLRASLSEINAAKSLVRRLPTADQVAAWVAEAKTLERVITH